MARKVQYRRRSSCLLSQVQKSRCARQLSNLTPKERVSSNAVAPRAQHGRAPVRGPGPPVREAFGVETCEVGELVKPRFHDRIPWPKTAQKCPNLACDAVRETNAVLGPECE